MLNLFKRNRKPASPAPVTGSLQIRNLLDYPQLQAVMTTTPVAAVPVTGPGATQLARHDGARGAMTPNFSARREPNRWSVGRRSIKWPMSTARPPVPRSA